MKIICEVCKIYVWWNNTKTQKLELTAKLVEGNISENMSFFFLFKNFIYSCIFQNTKDQDMKKLFLPSYLYGHDAQSLIMREDQTFTYLLHGAESFLRS